MLQYTLKNLLQINLFSTTIKLKAPLKTKQIETL